MTAEIAAADGGAVRLRGARRRATRTGSGREASCFYVTRDQRSGPAAAELCPACPGPRPGLTQAITRRQATLPMTGCAQKAQRRASMGISLRHSGHFFVVGSAGAGSLRMRATRALMGVTTKKYTAAATSRNEITALMNSP